MKEYEIVETFLNGCAGAAHPQTTFEEVELSDPGDYIKAKHGQDFDKFTKEIKPDGQIVYTYNNGTVCYIYKLTEI